MLGQDVEANAIASRIDAGALNAAFARKQPEFKVKSAEADDLLTLTGPGSAQAPTPDATAASAPFQAIHTTLNETSLAQAPRDVAYSQLI